MGKVDLVEPGNAQQGDHGHRVTVRLRGLCPLSASSWPKSSLDVDGTSWGAWYHFAASALFVACLRYAHPDALERQLGLDLR